MNHTPLALFFAFLVYLYCGVSAVQLAPQRRLNLLFAAACATFSLWALAHILSGAENAGEAARSFHRLAVFGSAFFTGLMLHFTRTLTGGKPAVKTPLFFAAAYAPPAFFFLMGVVSAPGSTAFELLALDRAVTEPGSPFLFWSHAAWHMSGLSACILMASSWRKRARSEETLRQARIFTGAAAASLGLALFANIALPVFGLKLPLLLLAVNLVWIFGVLRILARQRVITLRDANVTEHILDTMAEAIVLTGTDMRIISANAAALKLSGYGSGEIKSMKITDILRGEDGSAAACTSGAPAAGTAQNAGCLLKAKEGGSIPVLACASFVMGARNGQGAISFILNDITEIKKTELLLRKNEEKYRDLWENAPVAYHFLNASGRIVDVNLTECMMLGYSREEMLGKEIFEFISPSEREDSKKRFLEKKMGLPVPETQARCYLRKDGSPLFVNVSDSLRRDKDGRTTGIRTTMIDISRRVQAEKELARTCRQVEQSLEQMILVIARIVEMRDPYTAGHGRKVARLACRIAEELGFPRETINGVHMAATIHDIGKIYVPVEILSKPMRLSEIEFDIVKNHAASAHEILKDIEFPRPIAEIILQHHERIDGSGYPGGLKSSEILDEAKIIGIADVAESMVSFRPYRPALGIERALEEIHSGKGRLYDPGMADICAELFTEKGFMFAEGNGGGG